MIDKNVIKQIEKILRLYPFLLISLKNDSKNNLYKINPHIETKYHSLIINSKKIIKNLNEALNLLTEKEKTFLELRYFKNYSITKISIQMNYSEQMIFHIRKSLLNKLYFSLYPFIIYEKSHY